MARAPESCATSTDNRMCDSITIELSTLSIAYDWHLNAIQNLTDKTICKENVLVSLVLFSVPVTKFLLTK